MVFGSSQERKSFTVAPRLDDEKTTRVFVEANYHVAGGQTPLEAGMSESLATIWKDAFRVMELVDGRRTCDDYGALSAYGPFDIYDKQPTGKIQR